MWNKLPPFTSFSLFFKVKILLFKNLRRNFGCRWCVRYINKQVQLLIPILQCLYIIPSSHHHKFCSLFRFFSSIFMLHITYTNWTCSIMLYVVYAECITHSLSPTYKSIIESKIPKMCGRKTIKENNFKGC